MTHNDLEFLRELAAAAAKACRVAAGDSIRVGEDRLCNDLGLDAYLPSGHAYQGYRALWLRDFVMSIPALDLSAGYLQQAARLFAASQRTEDWIWFNGHVPAWTPAEHINLNGGYCYYPGGYFDDERQGGRWGPYPPMDNAFFFVDLVHHAFRANGPEGLHDPVDGIALFERACRAFGAVNYNPSTGLARSPAARRAVDFGFCDVVHKIGDVLFGSCLAYRAAGQLADMATAIGAGQQAESFQAIASRLAAALVPAFGTGDGFLHAATEVCRQRDVWGTAFAVYVGALSGEPRDAACKALCTAFQQRTAVRDGAVRHILLGDEWSRGSAWEYAGSELDTYQNGGYWLTASGWVLYAIAQVDPEAAERMLAAMTAHLHATDFRSVPGQAGPYEWHNPSTGATGKAVNLTSICCPLEAVERLRAEGRLNA